MLSDKAVKALQNGMADKALGQEVVDAVDALRIADPAANVPALGTTTNLSAISASYADLAAARTSVNTLKGEVEARLDDIEAKVDAVIAALVAAGLMEAP